MNFLSPAAFAFLAALPVVILFYMLKRKRVVKLVSSTLLWQRFLAETQASAPFQRLRHNWLLILQLLLLALVVFALSRPFLAGDRRTSRLRVLILDASASMQSTDEKPSRFEKARREALKWVDSLRDTDQMVVLVAAGNTEVKQSATSEKAALRRAISAATPTDSSTRLNEAFKLAETLIKNQPDPEIHLFSDGAMRDLTELANKNLPLVYHRIGLRGNNLGFATLDVRANPDNAEQRAIFTSLFNASTNIQQAEVELRFNNQVLDVRPVTVPPTNSLPLVFVAGQQTDGIFTVRLAAPDDLSADNQASVVSRLPQPVEVLLVSRGNRFLEKALRGAGNIHLTTVANWVEPGPVADVVVLDDVSPPVWPTSSLLAIHVLNTNLLGAASRLEHPAIVDWKSTHPLLRFVSFDNVQISETLRVKAQTWGVSIVEAAETPLIVAGEHQRQRIVWVGFDTLESTWPLRVSYPIFIANAIEWLNPASASADDLMVRAGEPFRFRLSSPTGPATVTKPDGLKVTIPPEASAKELVFGDTHQQGIYRLQAGTNTVQFCVNLLDAAESDITPRNELPFGKFGAVPAAVVKRANMEFWRWIAGVALVVLLVEWWYYHRRTA